MISTGEIVSRPRESNSSVDEHLQAGRADPEEAFLLAGDVGVGEVRPGVEGVVVVEQQRHDPDQPAEDVGAGAPRDQRTA